MTSLLSRIIRRASVAIAVGVIVGWPAFAVTATTPTFTYLGPLCLERVIEFPHFDLWTGEARGGSYVCDPSNNPVGLDAGPPRVVATEPPADMLGRLVVPVPVGFAIGSLGTMARFIVSDRRRSSPAA